MVARWPAATWSSTSGGAVVVVDVRNWSSSSTSGLSSWSTLEMLSGRLDVGAVVVVDIGGNVVVRRCRHRRGRRSMSMSVVVRHSGPS